MLSTAGVKGVEAQLRAELRANELGYHVSRPTTENCRYDMIIDTGAKLYRVQVKYCEAVSPHSRGAVVLDLRKRVGGGQIRCYSADEIDAVVVYVKPADCLCYIPASLISGRQTLTIRYEPSRNHQSQNVVWYGDYLW